VNGPTPPSHAELGKYSKGTHLNGCPWIPAYLTRVEARGFEPRSETRFTTASTCVSHRLRSPDAGQWAAHGWTSLLSFRRMPEGVTSDYPEFAILSKPPQEGFLKSRCSNS